MPDDIRSNIIGGDDGRQSLFAKIAEDRFLVEFPRFRQAPDDVNIGHIGLLAR